MDIRLLKNEIESSERFKRFKEDNTSSFLYSFIYVKRGENASTQLCYFMPEKRKVAVFDQESPEIMTEDEILLPQEDIKELKLNNFSLHIEDVLKIAKEDLAKDHKIDRFMQTIAILLGDEWSITLITGSFDIFNYRIDPFSGAIKDKKSAKPHEFLKKH